MVRLVLVEKVVESVRGRRLCGRPAHVALREPVPLVVRALTRRAAVDGAPAAFLLPPGDPELRIGGGEERLDRLEPAAFGELEVAG